MEQQTEWPRRASLELLTPAERAIYDAVQLVEQMGADVRLTDAVVAMQQARDSVADYVDDVPRRSAPTPASMFISYARALSIAHVCHETNRAYCQSIGDYSQPSWMDAPTWQRESAIAGVEAIAKNPATTPEQSHEGWMAQKVADGWTFGPVKDADKKQHPCMVPYYELPPEQRVKDHLFGAVARTLLGL